MGVLGGWLPVSTTRKYLSACSRGVALWRKVALARAIGTKHADLPASSASRQPPAHPCPASSPSLLSSMLNTPRTKVPANANSTCMGRDKLVSYPSPPPHACADSTPRWSCRGMVMAASHVALVENHALFPPSTLYLFLLVQTSERTQPTKAK